MAPQHCSEELIKIFAIGTVKPPRVNLPLLRHFRLGCVFDQKRPMKCLGCAVPAALDGPV